MGIWVGGDRGDGGTGIEILIVGLSYGECLLCGSLTFRTMVTALALLGL